MNSPVLNIAIDGPASSGKGTVARMVAQKLGFQYIDTGAMFRSVAVEAMAQNVDMQDEDRLRSIAQSMSFRFEWGNGTLRLITNGQDITDAIRTETVGAMASALGVHLSVRKELLRHQQMLAANGGVVMDGRDVGTVVLPDARLKIYLDASVSVRAERRMKDLHTQGIRTDLETLIGEIEARDHQDKNRKHAPLSQASDAIYIDSTNMSPEEATQRIVDLARSRA